MNTGEVIISDNGHITVHSVNGQVWLSKHQLAHLFDVYVSTIDAQIRSILKSGVVQVNVRHGATVVGHTILPDLYDFEMITALAFRINSEKAKSFREWVLKKAVTKTAQFQPQILLSIGENKDQYFN